MSSATDSVDTDVNLVVKHTFLELVEEPSELPQSRPRARTDVDAALLDSEDAGHVASTDVQIPGEPVTEGTPVLRTFWPETPLLEVGCAPEIPGVQLLNDSPLCLSSLDWQWLPPAAEGDWQTPAFDPSSMVCYQGAIEQPPSMFDILSTNYPMQMSGIEGESNFQVPATIPEGEASVFDSQTCDYQMPWMYVYPDCGEPYPVDCKTWDDASTAASTTSAGDVSHKSIAEPEVGGEWRTTVMLRNLPRELKRDMLTQMLDGMGFCGQYDFVYIPVDFCTGSGLGYAFINVVSSCVIQPLWQALDGFKQWPVEGEDAACSVSWSDPHQGLTAHIERYQNSPVMHAEVQDAWKPALFSNGTRVHFPLPTKKIKAPKVRSKKGNKTEGAKEEKSEVKPLKF